MLLCTWNVNSLKARLPRVEQWLEETSPDVVCLQETKMADEAFPALTFKALGYEAVHHGEGRWNGVAILSKVGLERPVFGFDSSLEADPQARLISATCNGIRVHSVYVPNGRALADDHYQYKLAWLGKLTTHLEKTCGDEEVVVAGDWNIAPEDIDVWNREFFEGSTHVSEKERTALAAVKKWGLIDTFREQYPSVPGLFSYYDYQAGRFHKRQGMRIDYILSSPRLAKTCSLNLVDRNARKGKKPSDHAPVLALFKNS